MNAALDHRKCLCSCGEVVRPGNRFIRGHNRRKNIDLQKVKFLYQEKLMSCAEVAESLGIGATTVRRVLGRIGVPQRNKKEASRIAVSKGKYFTQTPEGKKHLSRLLKGHSHNRIYQYDRAFFSHWNSKMAYILGLIAADGCVHQNKLLLSLKDRDILEDISSAMGRKPVYRRNGYYHLNFYSHQMVSDLKKLGIKPQKTFTLKPPFSISKQFVPHYIRGFFDGDGCFAYHKTNANWLSVFTNASYDILEWLKETLPINGGCLRKRTRNCFELRLGERDSLELGYFIYNYLSSEDLYLKRKFQLFNKLKADVEGRWC